MLPTIFNSCGVVRTLNKHLLGSQGERANNENHEQKFWNWTLQASKFQNPRETIGFTVSSAFQFGFIMKGCEGAGERARYTNQIEARLLRHDWLISLPIKWPGGHPKMPKTIQNHSKPTSGSIPNISAFALRILTFFCTGCPCLFSGWLRSKNARCPISPVNTMAEPWAECGRQNHIFFSKQIWCLKTGDVEWWLFKWRFWKNGRVIFHTKHICFLGARLSPHTKESENNQKLFVCFFRPSESSRPNKD